MDVLYLGKCKLEAIYVIDNSNCSISDQVITLVDFIGKLSYMSTFHVNSSNFGDEVPTLSNFPYLFELDLNNNNYTDKFLIKILWSNSIIILEPSL